MKKKKQRNIIIAVVVVVALVLIGWLSFGKKGSNDSDKSETVTVGVVGATKAERAIWKSVAQTAKKKYNVTVKIKNFSDYNQPNSALKSGDLDLNAFQHYNFLNNWNKANKSNLVAIGKTYIAGLLVKTVKGFASTATLEKDGKSCDMRKLMALMGMGVKQGETVTIKVEGDDEEAAAEAIQKFLSENV